jgi:signal peptidase I
MIIGEGLPTVKKLKQLNFRWALHLFWIVLLAGLFFYLNSSAPFQAIASNSMTPALTRGDLVLIQSVLPGEINQGDIIIFNVPQIFQKKYGYPAKVCHRVARIEILQGEYTFRTKGDAAGEDPFMVQPQDVLGKESRVISYLGYLVMFPQSSQGWFLLISLIVLYLVYINTHTIAQGLRKLRYAFFGVSADEYINSQREMEQKVNHMNYQVAQALNSFSGAMADYAKHLQSHTGAVKSLAQVAEHLESILPAGKPILIQQAGLVELNSPDNIESPVEETKPAVLTAIEVTPELRTAVKEFIGNYLNENNITSLEVTPELRAAVWDFINTYVQTSPESHHEDDSVSVIH